MRRLITSILFLTMLTAQAAQADALGNAFNDLLGSVDTATTSGGVFAGKTQTTISGGGVDIHFSPQRSVSLVSITPPSLSAGCGGISAFFGGMSYINGAEIQQLLQNIAQGVTAGLFMAAMGAICPQCEQWIAKAQDWLQKASALAINGCQMGMSIAQDMANKVQEARGQNCLNLASATNTASDTFEAKQSTCKDQSATATYLQSVWSSAFGADASSTNASTVNKCVMLKNVVGAGNSTWAALDQTRVWQNYPYVGILLMSLTGTNAPEVKNSSGKTTPNVGWVAPTISPAQFVSVYMCGTNPNLWPETSAIDSLPGGTEAKPTGGNKLLSVYTSLQHQCKRMLGTANSAPVQLLGCSSGSNNGTVGTDYLSGDEVSGGTGCPIPTKITLSQLDSITFPGTQGIPIGTNGFYYYVLATLAEGIDEISNNKPLTADVIALVNISPFPLYKALNVAAVYPGVAQAIVADNVQALGTLLSLAFLQHQLSQIRKLTNGKPICMPKGLLKAYRAAEQELTDEISKRYAKINQLYDHEQMIISQVKDVNKAILNNIYASGLASAAFTPRTP